MFTRNGPNPGVKVEGVCAPLACWNPDKKRGFQIQGHYPERIPPTDSAVARWSMRSRSPPLLALLVRMREPDDCKLRQPYEWKGKKLRLLGARACRRRGPSERRRKESRVQTRARRQQGPWTVHVPDFQVVGLSDHALRQPQPRELEGLRWTRNQTL